MSPVQRPYCVCLCQPASSQLRSINSRACCGSQATAPAEVSAGRPFFRCIPCPAPPAVQLVFMLPMSAAIKAGLMPPSPASPALLPTGKHAGGSGGAPEASPLSVLQQLPGTPGSPLLMRAPRAGGSPWGGGSPWDSCQSPDALLHNGCATPMGAYAQDHSLPYTPHVGALPGGLHNQRLPQHAGPLPPASWQPHAVRCSRLPCALSSRRCSVRPRAGRAFDPGQRPHGHGLRAGGAFRGLLAVRGHDPG